MKKIYWSPMTSQPFFTNVPLSETINILVDKAFTNDWFNQTYDLNLEKEELTQLLLLLLFQFDGQLYEQTDGVAMGSPVSWPANGQCVYVPLRGQTRTRRYGSLSL